MTIKHISFDVWNTLISANPRYAGQRTKIIANISGLPLHKADEAYTKVKRDLDNRAINYQCGPVEKAWDVLGVELNLDPQEVWVLQHLCEEAFLENPPILDLLLVDELMKLSTNFELSIKSNTNFISGKVLSEAVGFDRMPFWGFKHFSDQVELCKPDRRFFEETLRSSVIRLLSFNEVMHVGDNATCDGSAVDYSMKVCLINNPAHLLQTLTEGAL